MTSVSIAICTRNRADQLEKTLLSIANQTVPSGLTVDLTVVDNGSTDGTRARIESLRPLIPFPVHYEHESVPGVANARNTALKRTTGEMILWTDDDTEVPSQWIERMVEPLLDDEYDAVAGGVQIAPDLQRPWMQKWHRAFLASTDSKTRPPNDMVGANMAFARHVLEKVPGFDPEIGPGRLGLCEESHFAERLLLAGYRIADRMDVQVYHHFDPARLLRSGFLASARSLGRSQAYIHHHWRHQDEPFSHSAVRSRAAIVAMQLKLAAKRLFNLRDVLRTEGCAGWENYYVREIAYLKQSLIERKRSRRYPKLGSRPYDDAELPGVSSSVARARA